MVVLMDCNEDVRCQLIQNKLRVHTLQDCVLDVNN